MLLVDFDEFKVRPHVQFVLDCLTILPTVTGHLVIKKVSVALFCCKLVSVW